VQTFCSSQKSFVGACEGPPEALREAFVNAKKRPVRLADVRRCQATALSARSTVD
jgi:hypothetical protein